jgi:CARDB
MKKIKLILLVFVLIVSKNHLQAQDLLVESISMTNVNYATVIIKNASKMAINASARIYVELHTNSTQDNPIAQLQIMANPFLPNSGQAFTINFSDFVFRSGFSRANATKLFVIVDPKNEIKEKNENNNTGTYQNTLINNLKK